MKPTPVFPATVVIDTREQLGYPFAALPDDPDPDEVRGDYTPFTFADVPADVAEGGGLLTIPTTVATLPSGDYSLLGLESRVAIERKSIDDLFRTIGQERARFIRELERLAEFEFAAVVVEAEWSHILRDPPRYSQLPPKTIRRSVTAWMQRFPRVHWEFVPGRAIAEITTFRHLQRFYKDTEEAKREEKP